MYIRLLNIFILLILDSIPSVYDARLYIHVSPTSSLRFLALAYFIFLSAKNFFKISTRSSSACSQDSSFWFRVASSGDSLG